MSKRIEVKPRKQDDWVMDEKSYVLIRYRDNKIEVRVMAVQEAQLHGIFVKEGQVLADYVGTNPEDLYYQIIYDGWITNNQHAAYLGSELQRAYLAMKKGIKYIQDAELDL